MVLESPMLKVSPTKRLLEVLLGLPESSMVMRVSEILLPVSKLAK